jgi:hypothetical protein
VIISQKITFFLLTIKGNSSNNIKKKHPGLWKCRQYSTRHFMTLEEKYTLQKGMNGDKVHGDNSKADSSWPVIYSNVCILPGRVTPPLYVHVVRWEAVSQGP